MVDGRQCWSQRLSLDMVRKNVGGRVYETYNGLPDNLYAALQHTAAVYPNKAAIIDDNGDAVSYLRLLELVEQFAGYLENNLEIKKGSQVALMLYSGSAFCVSYLAAIRLGAVTLPLPSKFRQDEVLALLSKADPALIICDEDFTQWMEPFKNRNVGILTAGYLATSLPMGSGCATPCTTLPEEPAILMYTSGTTSLSKGVLLTNFNVMHSVETYRCLLGITPEDRTVIGVPIYHVTGLIALLSLFLYTGGTVYLHKRFDAKRILECIVRNGITFMHGSPTVFSMMLKEKNSFPELPTFRMIACGSSYMPKEKILAIHEWLPNTEFRTVYGMTETSSPATVFPCDTAVSPYISSCGLPVPGLEFRIAGEDGTELPPMQIGEVLIKGSVILREYYRLKTPMLTDDGWLSTGDMGYFNQEGYLFLVDRKKDMINRGGEKICSYDIEYELYKLPGVEGAAVVGIPDEIYGESAAAVVVPQPGVSLTEETVKAYLSQHLARYKIPVRILFTDQLPITANGKINKKEIRTWFQEGAAQ